MRKTIPAAMLAMTAPLLAVPAANAYPPPTCYRKVSHGYATPQIGSRLWDMGLRTEYIDVAIGYDSCRRAGVGTWVKPKWRRFTVNVSGRHMPCAASADASLPWESRGYFRTEFSEYYSAGRTNFHPARKAVYCTSDTTATRLVWYGRRVSKRLYWRDGDTPPRARVNYVVRMAGSHDPDGTIRVRFHRP